MARLSRSSPTCARAARVSLAAFIEAVVIVDPVQYQRRRDERVLDFLEELRQPQPRRPPGAEQGASGRAWESTTRHPGVLSSHPAASSHVQQQNKPCRASRRSMDIRPRGTPGDVTHSSRTGGGRRFAVDRFMDRATRANSAIRVIGGRAPWYPCR